MLICFVFICEGGRGRRGRDRMVVGFTTAYMTTGVVSSNLDQGEVYNIM